MKTLIRIILIGIVLIVMSAVMTSCRTRYIPLETTITEKTIVHDTIVDVKLTPYRDSISVASDSSYLFNPYAYSYARWDNGILHHSLGIFPNAFVPYRVIWLDKYITIKEAVPYPVKVIEKVEKKLTWWQRLKMETGGISLGVLFILFGYFALKILKTVKLSGWTGFWKTIVKR